MDSNHRMTVSKTVALPLGYIPIALFIHIAQVIYNDQEVLIKIFAVPDNLFLW